MPPRSSSPICERSLDLTLIGIGRLDIPQCSPKHFRMEVFYRTFSGGQRPSSFEGLFLWEIGLLRFGAAAAVAKPCEAVGRALRAERRPGPHRNERPPPGQNEGGGIVMPGLNSCSNSPQD